MEHKDYTGAKLGMWLFLATELILFGGLFLLYSMYRHWNPVEFHNAAKELDMFMGTLNTFILITSSMTMALSISTIQAGKKKVSMIFLVITIALGIMFLSNKYIEWNDKFHHGIYPNSPVLEKLGKGENIFYGLYFVMTGLHGIHVLVGIIILSVMFVIIARKPAKSYSIEHPVMATAIGGKLALLDNQGSKRWESVNLDKSVKRMVVRIDYYPVPEKFHEEELVGLENCGLYWHLIDIVWIFLFPLFYLVT